MALILARISPVTSPGSTRKTSDAISLWKSRPVENASISPASPLACAMIRISICE